MKFSISTGFVKAIKIALGSIRANFARSFLTILGIVVADCVIIAALLEGAQTFIVKATAEFALDALRIETPEHSAGSFDVFA